MTILLPLLAALLAQPFAPARPEGPRPGDVYEIRRVSEARWSESAELGSEGSSYDRDILTERVIAVRQDGVETEYDLPPEATADDRRREWQFPVRVLRPAQGPMQLLNRQEMEARLERWLAAAGLTREGCGRWYFTWNAFQVQCDPTAILEIFAAVDLTVQELREGATYTDPLGVAPASLRREGAAFTAEVAVDQARLLRQHAESQAVVTEIMGDDPQLRPYREARAPRRITGTIRVQFEAGDGGSLRRTRVLRTETEQMGGARENRTVTETVERRLVRPTR